MFSHALIWKLNNYGIDLNKFKSNPQSFMKCSYDNCQKKFSFEHPSVILQCGHLYCKQSIQNIKKYYQNLCLVCDKNAKIVDSQFTLIIDAIQTYKTTSFFHKSNHEKEQEQIKYQVQEKLDQNKNQQTLNQKYQKKQLDHEIKILDKKQKQLELIEEVKQSNLQSSMKQQVNQQQQIILPQKLQLKISFSDKRLKFLSRQDTPKFLQQQNIQNNKTFYSSNKTKLNNKQVNPQIINKQEKKQKSGQIDSKIIQQNTFNKDKEQIKSPRVNRLININQIRDFRKQSISASQKEQSQKRFTNTKNKLTEFLKDVEDIKNNKFNTSNNLKTKISGYYSQPHHQNRQKSPIIKKINNFLHPINEIKKQNSVQNTFNQIQLHVVYQAEIAAVSSYQYDNGECKWIKKKRTLYFEFLNKNKINIINSSQFYYCQKILKFVNVKTVQEAIKFIQIKLKQSAKKQCHSSYSFLHYFQPKDSVARKNKFQISQYYHGKKLVNLKDNTVKILHRKQQQ